jgi:hypothetical protein
LGLGEGLTAGAAFGDAEVDVVVVGTGVAAGVWP